MIPFIIGLAIGMGAGMLTMALLVIAGKPTPKP